MKILLCIVDEKSTIRKNFPKNRFEQNLIKKGAISKNLLKNAKIISNLVQFYEIIGKSSHFN